MGPSRSPARGAAQHEPTVEEGAAASETMVPSGSARRTRPSSVCHARRLPSSSSRMSWAPCPTSSWVMWMPNRTVTPGGSVCRPRFTALRMATAA